MAKHKYIETPEKMWELFEAYRNDVKNNPRHVYEYVGKDGEERIKPLERPLTMEGFELYVADLGELQDLGHYFANTDNRYADYCTICSRIKKAIRRDQIEGGMVGQYNASITQRLNGLAEKTQNENVQKIELFKGIDLSVKEDNSTE
jgi:hypothetical protein